MHEMAIDLNEAQTTISACFEEQAKRFADRTAIHSGDRVTTYGQLNASANRLAHGILEQLGEQKTTVALLLEQGVPLITGIFGALKAGKSFVPLDPSYPASRIQLMLDDAPTAIVTNNTNAAHAAKLAAGRPVINLDECAGRDDINPAVAIEPTDLAYLLYTSGSTGKPKGVMQDHRSVVHNMLRHRVAFKITEDDRQTQLYPCSVYGGTRDIFNALLNGAAIYHYPLRDLGHAGLADWLSEHRITIYCSVATVFRHFARELIGENLLPDLRIIKLGGEAPRLEDIELYRQRFCAHTEVSCGLGSTETGITRRFPVHRQTQWEGVGVPLGYEVPGVEILILDEDREPVPVGEIGELVIRSRYITRGYFGRDDLNQKVLLQDEQDPEVRLFFTGDLGVVDAQGCLVHKGRKDHQVKIRGNRVELHEIETLLGAAAGVKDAIVAAPINERGDVQLVGYLVPKPGETIEVHTLREGLKKELPQFMVPSVFVKIDAIPLTPNGKMDRLALPKPTADNTLATGSKEQPRNRQEHSILKIMRRLLNTESIGVEDSFFDVGGDSLLAVHLVLEVEKQLGQKLPLVSFTNQPSARGLSAAIDASIARDYEERVVALSAAGDKPPLFCFPGRGAAVIGFRGLAEHLGAGRPTYGMQYPGLDGEAPIDDLKQLATEMLKHLRLVQPDGPYYLYGYSFGGLVAYEVAQRIQQSGGEVAFLGLLDTYGPREHMTYRPMNQRTIHAARKLLKLPLAQKLDYLSSKFRKLTLRTHGGGAMKPAVDADDFGLDETIPTLLLPMVEASHKARVGYTPAPYAGRVDLFRCEETPGWLVPFNDDYGWAALVRGGLRIHPIPGKHTEVLKRNNEQTTAAALREVLAKLPATASRKTQKPSMSGVLS
jgi:amino acid adenylation domain-containing protein